MSRIGKMPIIVPSGVTIESGDQGLVVKGPKGELNFKINPHVKIQVADQINVEIADDQHKALHGLTRTIVANAIIGVSTGWERKIELVGVGYRAAGGGNELNLTIGFSHPVKVTAPKGVTFTISDNTKISVTGPDKKLVGEVAANIRAIRPPEPYKGKGIRFAGEVVRKKAGKAVKAAGAAA